MPLNFSETFLKNAITFITTKKSLIPQVVSVIWFF